MATFKTLATPINGINRNNQFIKSAMDDLQDPLFLTFKLDFFPEREAYPKGDGLMNSGLFKQPGKFDRKSENDFNPDGTVEYSAQDWLLKYYGNSYRNEITPSQPHPYLALDKFRNGLRILQDMPWYFQSITGIGDLWKAGHNVGSGKKETMLTINCLESIMQPLTDLVENYRYAVYDQARLAYRLPENLRWFDLVINLVEIREIVDHGGNIFKTDRKGNVLEGLKVIQFRCKMCEFDFSDFLSPVGSTEYYTYVTDKPFYPFFKIKVGWVIQEEVNLQDAADLKTIGLFSALSNIVGNRINKFIQGAGRLPGQLIGSVINPLTSALESNVFGSAYEGVASDITYDPDKPNKIPPLMEPIAENRPAADRSIIYNTDILNRKSDNDVYIDSDEAYVGTRVGPPNRFNPNPSFYKDSKTKIQVEYAVQNVYDTKILEGNSKADNYKDLPNTPYNADILAGKVDAYPDSNENYPTTDGPPNRFNPNPPVENIYDDAILAGISIADGYKDLPNPPYNTSILSGTADTYADSNEAYPGPRNGPPNRFNPNPPVENIYDTKILSGKSTAYDLSTLPKTTYNREILAGRADVYPNSAREPVVGPPTGNVYSR